MVYATGYYITDYSYVITEDSIHFVFLLSGIYGSKIVYVRKESNKVSKAKTIVENTLARDCIIAIIQNKVCIWWRTSRKLYSIVSYDMGESFKQQGLYKGKFETNSVKAVLVEKINKEINILQMKFMFQAISPILWSFYQLIILCRHRV